MCVQSISFSLMCHWFRVAVLPLDGELAAALLVPGKPETVCRLRGGLCPQIQPGKILPRLRRAHEENQSRREKAETKAEMSRFRAFQTRINQAFFVGVKGYAIHLSFSPRKRRFKCVTIRQNQPEHREVILSLIISGQTRGCPPICRIPVSC